MSRLGSSGKPSQILAQSVMTGLAALVRLAQARGNSQTQKYVNSMTEVWTSAKKELKENQVLSPHDFSSVQNIEHLLRQRWLDIIWHSTKRYGNREFKRIYSWREGSVGPLNGLLNYAGARLRDLATTHYSFPDPQHYLILQYSDGIKTVVPQSAISEDVPKDVAKKYWRVGYSGDSKSPRFLLSHPTLPELDFVDMIRGHVQELCRQLFIYNVPRNEAHRYIRLLVHRLKPFLDWFYSQGEIGRKDFYPDGDRELRDIVLEVRAVYGRRAGRRERLSDQLEWKDTAPLTVEFLKAHAESLCNGSTSEEIRDACDKILGYINSEYITEPDLQKLEDQISAISQREGNDWHRVLLSVFHHPRSLKSVLFAGDSMLERPTDRQFFAEVPIRSNTGHGKADLVLFVRRSVGQRMVWTPVMILELKTKTAFDYNLYWMRPRTKKNYSVPVLHGWKTRLTPKDWSTISTSLPIKRTREQLALYEKILLREYRQLVPQDAFAPRELWKGVVIVDTAESYGSILDALEGMLSSLQADPAGFVSTMGWTSHRFKKSGGGDRIALLKSPCSGPVGVLREAVMADKIKLDDPFEHRIADERTLTQYISVSSATSGGNAAAWHAKNWHLLHHIDEVVEQCPSTASVWWLDLLGSLPEHLRKRRFGLDDKSSDLLENITFLNLSNEVESFLKRKSNIVQSLTTIPGPDKTEHVIIIDGWADLNRMTPTLQKERLLALEYAILDTLPDRNVNIIWVDSGVKGTRMNETYQRPCLDVLPYDSPRRFQLDEVIWNIPTAPRVFGWQTPYADEKRIIVQDTPTSAPPWTTMIEVPILRKWARKFRGGPKRDKIVAEEVIMEELVTTQSMYGRNIVLGDIQGTISYLTEQTVQDLQAEAMTVSPALLRPRDEESIALVAEPESKKHSFSSRLVEKAEGTSLRERLHLCPIHPPPSPKRATEAKMYANPLGIPRHWYHKTERETEAEKHYTRKPPLYGKSELIFLDSPTARRREIRRLRDAAWFLKRLFPVHDDMHGLCGQVYSLCEDALDNPDEPDRYVGVLLQVRDLIIRHPSRARAWQLIEPYRELVGEVLGAENRLLLADIRRENPDILSLYGNNLLMGIMAALAKTVRDEGHSAAISLWESVVEWLPYQMGFAPVQASQERIQSVYDFQTIFANLLSRAGYLTMKDPQVEDHMDEIALLPAIYRPGLLVGKEDHLWFLFERPDGQAVCGLMRERQERLRLGFQWCSSNPAELSDSAQELLDASCLWIEESLAVTNVGGQEILWGWSHDEDEWGLVGRLDYGSHQDSEGVPSLLWVRLSPLSMKTTLNLEECPIGAPIHSLERFHPVLERLAGQQHRVISVTCEVTVDLSQETYVVRCKSSRELYHEFLTPRTKEVVAFLRSTALNGRSVTNEEGAILTWDHLTDIEYGYAGSGEEWFSLSFLKPLVHRSRFFESYAYPENAEHLLSAQMGPPVTMHICYDKGIMVMHRFLHPVLTVRLDGLPENSHLKKLEGERMNIYDVALLAELEQLIDISTGSIHPLEFDVTAITSVGLPVKLETSRLANLLLYRR